MDIARDADGIRLVFGSQGTLELGSLAAAAEWLLDRPGFALQELFARYRHIDEARLERLVSELERRGLVFGYQPERG